MIKIIHIKDSTGSSDEVYIGRAGHGYDGYFGNPIVKGKECQICHTVHEKPGDTLSCFKKYAMIRLRTDKEYGERIKALDGKTLVCFCKNEHKCHGSVLRQLSNTLNDPLGTIINLVNKSIINGREDFRTIHDKQQELGLDDKMKNSNNPYSPKLKS